MLRRRTFLTQAAVAAGATMMPVPLFAHPKVQQAVRGTSPLRITAVEPIVIRAPKGEGPPAGPVVLGDVGATTGGKGLWNRLDHASPSRTPGVEQATLVKITTDQGLIGWGECHAPVAPTMQAQIIRDLFGPLLVGQDARQVEALWQRLYQSERVRGYSTGAHIEAIAGIDLALWDILGKFANAPLYQLLGGAYRDTIPTYATFSGTYVGRDKSSAVVDAAKKMAASGFTVLKLALRRGPDSDEFAMVKEIAAAIAPDAQVAVDALGAFHLNEAVRMGRELDRIGNIAWFEDALLPDDLPKYPELARSVDTAICTGEMLSTRYQFRDLLIDRGADIVNPDVGRAGGITECRRIAWIADVFGALWSPHVSTGTAPYMAASIHMAVSSPNCAMMEVYDGNKQDGPLGNRLLQEPLEIGPGFAKVPERPGLGVSFDEQALAAIRVG
ncbi:MAG TPA: mandelate racemase/muconate lactonizing enzyme family protein [Vicinamibacterales bacterium]